MAANTYKIPAYIKYNMDVYEIGGKYRESESGTKDYPARVVLTSVATDTPVTGAANSQAVFVTISKTAANGTVTDDFEIIPSTKEHVTRTFKVVGGFGQNYPVIRKEITKSEQKEVIVTPASGDTPAVTETQTVTTTEYETGFYYPKVTSSIEGDTHVPPVTITVSYVPQVKIAYYTMNRNRDAVAYKVGSSQVIQYADRNTQVTLNAGSRVDSYFSMGTPIKESKNGSTVIYSAYVKNFDIRVGVKSKS